MPPSQTRSRSGCLTCKARRKKCDETKPSCQRCERAGIQCSGYSYLGGADDGKIVKNWTQPAYSMPPELFPVTKKPPRSNRSTRNSSKSTSASPTDRAAVQATPGAGPSRGEDSHIPASHSDTSPDLFNSPFDLDPTLSSVPTTSEALENWWNLDPTLLPPSQEAEDFSHILQQQTFQLSDASAIPETLETLGSQYSIVPQPLTPGQASLFHSLLSLSNVDSAAVSANFSQPPVWASPATHLNTEGEDLDDEGDEDETVKQIIYGTMRLDVNAEGNALPYVLESYAAWITRTAFEPKKAAPGARDLILKQFSDSEDSKWTIMTLADVVRTLAQSSTWGEGLDSVRSLSYQPAVRALRERVRHKIDEIVSYSGPMGRAELSNALKTLGNVMEIASIYYTTASLIEALDFMRAASPLFRFLCPDPPDNLIQLQPLLLQPIISLRHYAIVDIFSSVPIERNMIFQYDTSYDPKESRSIINFSAEGGLQWLHGIPDVIIIVFARINIMREQGYMDPRAVADIESLLRSFVAIPSVSSDPFLTVARIMVQECWRQSAYIYLYMGACHINADDARVKKALSKFMKLLEGTKPGHTPDAFLMMNCLIGGIASRNNRDRNIIRQRMLNSERFKYPGAEGNVAVMLLEYIWLRSDGERRPAVWADLQVATKLATRRPQNTR